MKRVLLAVLVFACFALVNAYAEENIEENENGRYAMYIVEINKKPTPFLLDTYSGKVWYYSEGQASSLGMGVGEKPKFKGVTIEGLAYASTDLVDLEKQVDAYHTAGFINKSMLSFNERLLGEYSYTADLEKIKVIYQRSKLEQPRKE